MTPFLYYGFSGADPDIRSLSGFIAPDPVMFLAAGKKSALLVSMMEYGRACKESNGCAVENPTTLGVETGKGMDVWALNALKKRGFGAVEVPPAFPLYIVRALEAAGIKVEINKEGPARERRLVKTESEIANIAATQKAARAAMRVAEHAIKQAEPGRGGVLRFGGKILTSAVLRTLVRAEFVKHNCIDFSDTIVAGGIQACDCHQRGEGPLKTGEFIVCDFFPKSLETGYWGDMTRTFFNGEISAEQRKMHNAVKRAHDAVIKALKPGVTGADMHKIVVETFKKTGFENGTNPDGTPFGFFHGTGHGVGLDIHEGPSLSGSGGPLPENAVVTVEPGLYYQHLGGVRIEDTVVITKNGAKIL
ncbi:MAG: Xaa-Pro peptidase family protein [Kiritimatiellaeota bacterium]|nr:Xaa-Pro peptidase family protein [Kiritimatiellota bacterium]